MLQHLKTVILKVGSGKAFQRGCEMLGVATLKSGTGDCHLGIDRVLRLQSIFPWE